MTQGYGPQGQQGFDPQGQQAPAPQPGHAQPGYGQAGQPAQPGHAQQPPQYVPQGQYAPQGQASPGAWAPAQRSPQEKVAPLALLVLAIIAAVQGAGRGRTGALVVIAAIVLSMVVYWIIMVVLQLAVGSGSMSGALGVVAVVVEVLRWVVVAAALIVGAVMVRRWAAQRA